jgi:hypothetical protein
MGRDAFLSKSDILKKRKQLDNLLHRIHEDDSLNAQYWVERNKVDAFLLNLKPFTPRIMTRWKVEHVVRNGHKNSLVMDSNLCINKYKAF